VKGVRSGISGTHAQGDGSRVAARVVLMATAVVSVAFLAYRVAVLFRASASSSSPHAKADLIVTVLAAILAVGYFSWTAAINHSRVMLGLAITEGCLIAGGTLPVFRAALAVNPVLPIIIAAILLVAWLYSWLEFGRVYRFARVWTGWQ
jgi:hypothetical protein